jgi:demethylmenaquinone methyltransferase/2-methoxy-6-polyprenyl-1,4-benzoquinol methylase
MTHDPAAHGPRASDPAPPHADAAPADARFAPHAGPEMARMFDGVSGRYDLLNTLMTLGQDGGWRRALWRAVPERATRVLDLCTGNGVSLAGLRRPGRLVVGVDVSLGMLEAAAAEHAGPGWAPRLVCADAFRLPLRDGALDAITVAFGLRNLRPRGRALAELRRVLRPGGTLAVLEAAAPGRGAFGRLHAFHLRHVVPLLGRLSPDPSAYRYLRDSIFEFGTAAEFEAELTSAGFTLEARRAFLFGATWLWTARRGPGAGENAATGPAALHPALPGASRPGEMPQRPTAPTAEWRWWTGVHAVVSAVLTAGLALGLRMFFKYRDHIPLGVTGGRVGWWLLVLGILVFALRTVVLIRRFLSPATRR